MELDFILEGAYEFMASPWVYVFIIGLAIFDACAPILPAESMLIAAGSFAASGAPTLALVILAGATGGFIGDHLAFAIGRRFGPRVLRRLSRRERGRRAVEWTEAALHRRGPVVVIIGRFIPAGRTAVAMTLGSIGYPVRRFTPFVAVAVALWATYCAMLGYAGGTTFQENPLLGLAVGLAMAALLSALAETARRIQMRRALAAQEAVDEPEQELQERPGEPRRGEPEPAQGEQQLEPEPAQGEQQLEPEKVDTQPDERV